jgi:hypothetical protein
MAAKTTGHEFSDNDLRCCGLERERNWWEPSPPLAGLTGTPPISLGSFVFLTQQKQYVSMQSMSRSPRPPGTLTTQLNQ